MYELAAGGNINYVYAFALISLFFLLSSGINYTNLAIVASAHRHREIGVRKVMGAYQVQLVKQFMTESFVIILLSSALGVIIFYMTIPGFNSLMGSELSVRTPVELQVRYVRDPRHRFARTGMRVLSCPCTSLNLIQ